MKNIIIFISKVCRKIQYYFEPLRDKLEWEINLIFTNQAIWCKNRLGQLYQPISFPEYCYMRDGNPEMNVSLLVERLLEKGMTVVDVGANHGLFSMEASQFVGSTGHVYAFEPTPELCERLRKHFEVNHIENVSILEQAVGNFDGTAQLRVHHEYSGLNSLAENNLIWQGSTLIADSVIDIPILKLDSLAKSKNILSIDLLKIDVEGFELSVLEGATHLIKNRKIKYIILEIAECHECNSSLSSDSLISFLYEYGYSIHSITSQGEIGLKITNKSQLSEFGSNFICVLSSKRKSNAETC